ncbi:MAG: ribonuclease HII, partial [Chloroflexota bacterium]
MAAADKATGHRFPDLSQEAVLQADGFLRVAGVDEAGRGAWAGPLVAGAVILPDGDAPDLSGWLAVRDSKMLTHEQREAAFETILTQARAVGVGSVAPDEIDLLGLTAANELAMARAIRSISPAPDALLVDAFLLHSVPLPQRALIRGD